MTHRWDRPCAPSPFDINASCRNGRVESSTKALGLLQRGTCCKCILLITAEFDFNSASSRVVSGSMLGPKWRRKLCSVWLMKSRLTLIGCGWGSHRMPRAIAHGDTNNHFLWFGCSKPPMFHPWYAPPSRQKLIRSLVSTSSVIYSSRGQHPQFTELVLLVIFWLKLFWQCAWTPWTFSKRSCQVSG